MAKIPFKVSARAARLIGRENVATSQGAITELVKNAYDADATACAIFFLPRESEAPKSISEKQYAELLNLLTEADSFYSLPLMDGKRVLRSDISEMDLATVNAAFRDILDLWIVDNGHGMSTKTIEDHWMVIGTDVKEVKDTSVGGRVVTGAKGIGRFALDRLGQECDLFSGETGHSSIARWFVDWSDFEGDGKIIDDVNAVLDTESRSINMVYQEFELTSHLPKTSPSRDESEVPLLFDRGTAIKISFLHDRWDQRDSLKLKQTLEALLPPREQGDFNIFVYDYRAVKDSGRLTSATVLCNKPQVTIRMTSTTTLRLIMNNFSTSSYSCRPNAVIRYIATYKFTSIAFHRQLRERGEDADMVLCLHLRADRYCQKGAST